MPAPRIRKDNGRAIFQLCAALASSAATPPSECRTTTPPSTFCAYPDKDCVASGSAGAAEMEEAEELRRVISAVELVGRNTYLPLAERCLDGMRGGTASAQTK